MPTSSICHSWSASAETGRVPFSHCWVSSQGETGCRRQRPALARRSTAAACHRSGGMVAGLGARREPAERRQRGPTKLADPGYASGTAGEADCVAAEDGWGGVMQIIVCRRGLPRSGLHLAYVAVGRDQGRAAARPRGRAPHRGRVVSAAPASDVADREDISPLAASSIGGGVLPARVHRRSSRSGLHRRRPGGPRRPPAGDVRLLADGAAACRSVPPQALRPHVDLTAKIQLAQPISPAGCPCGPPSLTSGTPVKRRSSRSQAARIAGAISRRLYGRSLGEPIQTEPPDQRLP